MTAMVSATASGRLPRARAGGWIASPLWDFFWMFAALWGGALLLAASSSFGLAAAAAGIFFAERLVSIAHSWSTTWMVLFSPLLAVERMRRRAKFIWIPLAITLGSFALGIFVAGWQRFPASGEFGPELWAFGLYISLFWVLHFWHFGNQDFGVLSLYRSRAGQTRALDRRVDKLYTVLMMFLIQPIVYLCAVKTTAFAELTRALLPFSDGALGRIAPFALGVAAVASVGVAAFEIAKPNRSPGKLLYTVVMLLHPLLLFGSIQLRDRGLAYLYLLAYLWSHWFIAIGLVGRINTGYYRRRGDSRAWLARAPCPAARRDLRRDLAAHLSVYELRALQHRRLPLQAAARPDRPGADARDRAGAGLLPRGAAPALLLRPLSVPVPRRGGAPRRRAASLTPRTPRRVAAQRDKIRRRVARGAATAEADSLTQILFENGARLDPAAGEPRDGELIVNRTEG